MKKLTLSTIAVIAIILCGVFASQCGSGSSESSSTPPTETQPINITIFLDLSDRLIRENVIPSQMEIDTAIVNHIVDIFIADCIKSKIIGSKNSFQVLFYPTPNLSSINTLTADLKLDLSKISAREKKSKLIKLKETVPANLGVIYNDVIGKRNWIGCDIWDFFSSKKIDRYCIKEGYRNIIVILTDGYLYHENHKIKEGKDKFSYILPQTLNIPTSSLIVQRNELTNLEILILEVNPYQPAQRNKLISTLSDWLEGMGVDKTNYLINETDTEKNTEIIIDSFFN